MRPVGGVDNNRVVGDAKVIHRLEYLSDDCVVLDHSVSVFRPRIKARLVPIADAAARVVPPSKTLRRLTVQSVRFFVAIVLLLGARNRTQANKRPNLG